MSSSLQAKDLCVAEVQKFLKKTVETLKKMRCDENFEPFWKDIQNKAANLHIDHPKLPRKRRVPGRIGECLVGIVAPDLHEDIVLTTGKFTMKPWII